MELFALKWIIRNDTVEITVICKFCSVEISLDVTINQARVKQRIRVHARMQMDVQSDIIVAVALIQNSHSHLIYITKVCEQMTDMATVHRLLPIVT